MQIQVLTHYDLEGDILKKRLLSFARSVLLDSEITPCPTIERIQALLLLAIYQEVRATDPANLCQHEVTDS